MYLCTKSLLLLFVCQLFIYSFYLFHIMGSGLNRGIIYNLFLVNNTASLVTEGQILFDSISMNELSKIAK